MKLVIFLLATMMVCVATAQTVLNTFSAGDVVSSSKINQNFSILANKSKRVKLKMLGAEVGVYLGGDTVITNEGYIFEHANLSYITSANAAKTDDLIADLRKSTDVYTGAHVLYFLTNDCSGDAYTTQGGRRNIFLADINSVFSIYFTPEDAAEATNFGSFVSSSNLGSEQDPIYCVDTHLDSSYVSPYGLKALPNDPAVTGWPNTYSEAFTLTYE